MRLRSLVWTTALAAALLTAAEPGRGQAPPDTLPPANDSLTAGPADSIVHEIPADSLRLYGEVEADSISFGEDPDTSEAAEEEEAGTVPAEVLEEERSSSLERRIDRLHRRVRNRQVAFTFDDLPGYGDLQRQQRVVRRLLAALEAESIQAVGFVNEGKLYAEGGVQPRIDLLEQWLDEGHELGNHTFSHLNPHEVSLEIYTNDILRGETVTRRLLNRRDRDLIWFRHPYLYTGPSEEYRKGIVGFLVEHDYRIAEVTIDSDEWIFGALYRQASSENDVALMDRLGGTYIAYMENVFEHFERLCLRTWGREIRQVLLLHASELNADYLPQLAEMLRERGYSFVTLKKALRDRAYNQKEGQHDEGLSWIHRWRAWDGYSTIWEPDPPEWVMELYRQSRSSAASGYGTGGP